MSHSFLPVIDHSSCTPTKAPPHTFRPNDYIKIFVDVFPRIPLNWYFTRDNLKIYLPHRLFKVGYIIHVIDKPIWFSQLYMNSKRQIKNQIKNQKNKNREKILKIETFSIKTVSQEEDAVCCRSQLSWISYFPSKKLVPLIIQSLTGKLYQFHWLKVFKQSFKEYSIVYKRENSGE